jgi:glutamate 5-kinase
VRPVVVKLGSSIVASDDGEVRGDVLAAICDEMARVPDAVLVTSGAIARGMRVMQLPARPSAIADLQAASAVGQGKLFRVYDELLRERGRVAAQVLLTFHDMRERTHYLNARQTLRRLLEWRALR